MNFGSHFIELTADAHFALMMNLEVYLSPLHSRIQSYGNKIQILNR